MANTVLTSQIVANETLNILANNLVAAAKVNRRFENQFGYKIGSSLTIRKPNRFIITNGPGLTVQGISEPSTSITLSSYKQVAFEFSTQELTLNIEEFGDRYLKPAGEAMANQVDADILANWSMIFSEVGTPGTVPNAFSFLASVGKRLDKLAAAQSNRCLLLGPDAYWSMAQGLSGLFVQSVAEPALKGYLAKIANLSIYEDQNVQVQTVGNYAGSGTVNGASQSGSSLITHGWTASISTLLNVGDVFSIAGVNFINPQSRLSTGEPAQFVVTAPASSDGSGNSTLQISPAIIPPVGGQPVAYQTVDSSPANGAAITVLGTAGTSYVQNVAFTEDTFGLAMVPLEMPDGVDFKAQVNHKGIGLRVIRAYDINADVLPCRVDMLYGTATFYPETGTRLTN